ncbi:MAG TPA: hypothetical protein VEL76_13300, partial [Gemmataceae bacterium]|nr:hypothetical protein [Gemmataceae bacterium]
KASVLRLGYSDGAPPVFFSIFLCYFLDVGPVASTVYALVLIALVLAPVRFPITSLVTTHWQPGWQSITNYLVALAAVPVLLWLREAPRLLSWLLLVSVAVQLFIYPVLLRLAILRPGFNRRF